MIIDVVVASTSRFQTFGPVVSPELAEDLSGKVIMEKIKAEGYISATGSCLTELSPSVMQ